MSRFLSDRGLKSLVGEVVRLHSKPRQPNSAEFGYDQVIKARCLRIDAFNLSLTDWLDKASLIVAKAAAASVKIKFA